MIAGPDGLLHGAEPGLARMLDWKVIYAPAARDIGHLNPLGMHGGDDHGLTPWPLRVRHLSVCLRNQ